MHIIKIGKNRSLTLSVLVVLIGLLAAFFIVGFVEAQSTQNITFPIPELGNCANERECYNYCDNLANIGKCIDFAEANDLMSSEEVKRARAFSKVPGMGPGGCESKRDCEAYCSNLTNARECLLFAEENNILSDRELRDLRGIARALDSGLSLPGGCSNERECKAYCEVSTNFDECIEFAESSGILTDKELNEAKRFRRFLEEEETPGNCRDERECNRYCSDPGNFDECIEFAEKAGFIDGEEASTARRVGGKRGPGGCISREECERYCNNPANHDQCFAFAREHGLIPEEELRHIEEGVNHLRIGLRQAPPEVRSCLRDRFGDKIISDIESGRLVPNRKIGEGLKDCFERFGGPPPEKRVQEAFEFAPPEVIQCLESELGVGVIDQLRDGNFKDFFGSDKGDVFRRCFERFGDSSGPGPGPGGHDDSFDRSGPNRGSRELEGIPFDPPHDDDFGRVRGFQPGLPEEQKACAVNIFGPDFNRLLSGGDINPKEFEESVHKCVRERFGGTSTFPQGEVKNVRPNFVLPPEIDRCVRVRLGDNFQARLVDGSLRGSDLEDSIRFCKEKLIQQIPLDGFDVPRRERFQQNISPIKPPPNFDLELKDRRREEDRFDGTDKTHIPNDGLESTEDEKPSIFQILRGQKTQPAAAGPALDATLRVFLKMFGI